MFAKAFSIIVNYKLIASLFHFAIPTFIMYFNVTYKYVCIYLFEFTALLPYCLRATKEK